MCYDSCEAYAANDGDADWSIPSHDEEDFAPISRSRTFPPSRSHSPSQRARRQANARLLCTPDHREDISALVARMVRSNDQCSVNQPLDSMASSAAIDEDEGYDSSEGLTPVRSRRSSLAASKIRAEFRRSSDMKKTGACVNKTTRMRRDERHSHRRSSERLAS